MLAVPRGKPRDGGGANGSGEVYRLADGRLVYVTKKSTRASGTRSGSRGRRAGAG